MAKKPGKRDKPVEVFTEWCPVCRVHYPPSQAAVHATHTVGR